MPEEDNEILKYNQGEKSMKVPFIIYADLQSLLEKMNSSKNEHLHFENPEILHKLMRPYHRYLEFLG